MHNAHIMQIAQCTIYSNRRVGIQVTTVLPLSHIFHIFSSETLSPHFFVGAPFSSFSCQSHISLIFFIYVFHLIFLSELHSSCVLIRSTFFTFSYQSYILLIILLELHSSNFFYHSHILHILFSVLHSPYFLIRATFSSFLVPATPDCTCQIF